MASVCLCQNVSIFKTVSRKDNQTFCYFLDRCSLQKVFFPSQEISVTTTHYLHNKNTAVFNGWWLKMSDCYQTKSIPCWLTILHLEKGWFHGKKKNASNRSKWCYRGHQYNLFNGYNAFLTKLVHIKNFIFDSCWTWLCNGFTLYSLIIVLWQCG